MVLKRRIDHDFIGFQFANIPRGPRSIRKRAPHKKSTEDGNICAFDLLASLASKLLQENEASSVSSNVSEEHDQHVLGKDAIKAECGDPENCEASVVSEVASQNGDQKCLFKKFLHSESDAALERTSTIDNFSFPDLGKSSDENLENEFGQHVQKATGGLTEEYIPKDPLELLLEFPAFINSNGNVKLPLSRSVPNASFTRQWNDIKLGSSRDDDEKLSRFNKLSTKFKAYRSNKIGDCRSKKLFTSKYWNVTPTLKDYEFSKADGGIKPLYRKRKTCYNHKKFQRNSLYKRKKNYDQNSLTSSDEVFSSESVSNSRQKGSTGAELHGANGVSCSLTGHQASFHQKDSNVKFSIKSFRVPELFIEVPETATVGSLKRTVMEAVTALLGGGIHIGVLLQGKKVRDNNRTLSQTGISSKDDLNSLGFTLEPCAPPLLERSGDLPCETPQQKRSPVPPVLDSRIHDTLSSLTDTSKPVDSTHESVSQFTDISTDNNLPDSRNLVPVPVNQKARRSELVQRRARRPFSVTEVEALVHADEELGTGRWRDVKLRAFENAGHRTYVDLKDKWKTLVHTSQIGPQQRKGEPVPQEMLDRVMAAHAYWSQHQAKTTRQLL